MSKWTLDDVLRRLPRPTVAVLRYACAGVVLVLLVSWYTLVSDLSIVSSPFRHGSPQLADGIGSNSPSASDPNGLHPIDYLIQNADREHEALLAKEVKDVYAAAKAYRERRGRHPPPGFQAWFEFAQAHGGLMIEDFFDQIHHDLNPFWGLEPATLRRHAKTWKMGIHVRNGNATCESTFFWAEIWLSLVKTFEEYLPDMDIPLNTMDESRLLVPWEKINEYMEAEEKTRRLAPKEEMNRLYSGVADVDHLNITDWTFETKHPYFALARRGCPPDSPSRRAEVMTDWSRPPHISMQYAGPHSYRGYVANWTLATSICHQPDLQALHGYFIEPLSIKSYAQLIPLFGGSKLSTNNEILLPPAMYWADDKKFHANSHGNPWPMKKDALVWRGAGSGGRHKAENWYGFHRQRFITMVNASEVQKAETWEQLPVNFELPSRFYDLKAARNGHLGDWISTFSDAGFNDMLCFPKDATDPDRGTCRYIGEHMVPVGSMTLGDQFQYKYLPDMDGNSFSGRYRAFLKSNGVPIKATIFKEWHDSRLVAWKHFVPMDNRFGDIWGIMEYFLGYSGNFHASSSLRDGGSGDKAGPLVDDKANAVPRHDNEARKIAMDGQAWANRVLRREDMQIYVLRLLLEYARVIDDAREGLGYVADL